MPLAPARPPSRTKPEPTMKSWNELIWTEAGAVRQSAIPERRQPIHRFPYCSALFFGLRVTYQCKPLQFSYYDAATCNCLRLHWSQRVSQRWSRRGICRERRTRVIRARSVADPAGAYAGMADDQLGAPLAKALTIAR